MKNSSDDSIILLSSRIDIKPLSVNKCWQGKRFKTQDYEIYEKELLLTLPAFNLNKTTQPLHVSLLVGVSNLAFDADNAIKPFLDIMQKKFNFDDRYVMRLWVEKVVVKKGFEFIEFAIKKYSPIVETFAKDKI